MHAHKYRVVLQRCSSPAHHYTLCAGTVQTEAVNMAADGMVLTNHDHQTRVGILTGKLTVS